MSRRPFIPQRKRVFLGCEGESEQSYGRLLQDLLNARHRRIHLDTVLLRPGGGDPLALVELAARKMAQNERRAGPYAARAVLLDRDRIGQAPDRDAQLVVVAQRAQLHLIWQEPCHEAVLLRHLPDCDGRRPATTRQAETDLVRAWPTYQKGLPAARLAERLHEASVLQAGAVEPLLAAFLDLVEFGRD
jgi:hypothetical protein